MCRARVRSGEPTCHPPTLRAERGAAADARRLLGHSHANRRQPARRLGRVLHRSPSGASPECAPEALIRYAAIPLSRRYLMALTTFQVSDTELADRRMGTLNRDASVRSLLHQP